MTVMPRSWKSASPTAAALGANAPSRANSRKITPFAIINCFTARVNGGKLMLMVGPRRIACSVKQRSVSGGSAGLQPGEWGIIFLARAKSPNSCLRFFAGLKPGASTRSTHLNFSAASALRQRHNCQTAISSGIEGTYCKDYIVLRDRQSRTRDITDPLRVLPVGRRGVAPQHFVAGRQSAGGRIPSYSGIVLQLLRQQAHVCRRRRRQCQRSQGGRVQPGHVGGVVEIYKLRQVTIFDAVLGANVLVLMVVILAEFCEAHRSVSLLVEGEMIAAAQVAVAPEDHERLKSRGRKIFCRD